MSVNVSDGTGAFVFRFSLLFLQSSDMMMEVVGSLELSVTYIRRHCAPPQKRVCFMVTQILIYLFVCEN
jgi:hypothetical protein